MLTRAKVVAEARSWVGTPYLHQGDRKRLGVDCAGLVRGVCIELGIWTRQELLKDPRARQYRGYGREPNGMFLDACDAFLSTIQIADMGPGDVVAMRFAGRPRHTGILGEHPHGGLTLIHSYKHSVIEHRLDEKWRRRIVAAFALPGVDYGR